MRRALLPVLGLLLLTGLASAADVTGKWKGAMQGGSGNELTFDLKADGDALTGTVSGLLDRALKIEKGEVEGSELSFAVMSEWQGSPVRLVYDGELARMFHKESAARRDKPASTSLRLLAVLAVLFEYASARQASRASYPRASDASRFHAL